MKSRSGNHHQHRDVDYHHATADPMMSRSDSAMTFRRDASTSMTTRGEDDEKYTTRENSVFSLNHAHDAHAQAKPRMSRLGDASRLRSSGRQPEVLDADAEDAMMMTMVARRRWYTLVRTHALSDCATVAVNDAELAMLEAEILCAEGGAGTPGPRRRVATVADVGACGASGRGGMPDGDDLEEEYEEEAVVVVGGDIWKTAATTTTTTTGKDGRTANATADATTSALRAQDSAEDGATLARNPPAVAANNASQQKPGGPCDHCGAVDSPQWRRGPAAKPMLCNACGTRYRRTNNLGAAPSRSGTPEKRRANAIVSSTSNANSPRPGKKSARYAPAVERNHRTTVTC